MGFLFPKKNSEQSSILGIKETGDQKTIKNKLANKVLLHKVAQGPQ